MMQVLWNINDKDNTIRKIDFDDVDTDLHVWPRLGSFDHI